MQEQAACKEAHTCTCNIITQGWEPTCDCTEGLSVPAVMTSPSQSTFRSPAQSRPCCHISCTLVAMAARWGANARGQVLASPTSTCRCERKSQHGHCQWCLLHERVPSSMWGGSGQTYLHQGRRLPQVPASCTCFAGAARCQSAHTSASSGVGADAYSSSHATSSLH